MRKLIKPVKILAVRVVSDLKLSPSARVFKSDKTLVCDVYAWPS